MMFTFFTRAVANPGYVNLGREQPKRWWHQSVILTNPPPPKKKLRENGKKNQEGVHFPGAPMDPPMQGVCNTKTKLTTTVSFVVVSQ